MEKSTQRDIVRNYLLKGNSITPLEAFNLCNTMRLSAIIYELRHDEQLPILMAQPEAPEKPYAMYWIDKAYFANQGTQQDLFNK